MSVTGTVKKKIYTTGSSSSKYPSRTTTATEQSGKIFSIFCYQCSPSSFIFHLSFSSITIVDLSQHTITLHRQMSKRKRKSQPPPPFSSPPSSRGRSSSRADSSAGNNGSGGESASIHGDTAHGDLAKACQTTTTATTTTTTTTKRKKSMDSNRASSSSSSASSSLSPSSRSISTSNNVNNPFMASYHQKESMNNNNNNNNNNNKRQRRNEQQQDDRSSTTTATTIDQEQHSKSHDNSYDDDDDDSSVSIVIIIRDVIQFKELTNNIKILRRTKSFSSDQQQQEQQLVEITERLMEYLNAPPPPPPPPTTTTSLHSQKQQQQWERWERQQSNNNNNSSPVSSLLISQLDIIKLLLPWTIQQIMRISSLSSSAAAAVPAAAVAAELEAEDDKLQKDDDLVNNNDESEEQAKEGENPPKKNNVTFLLHCWTILLRCLQYLQHDTKTSRSDDGGVHDDNYQDERKTKTRNSFSSSIQDAQNTTTNYHRQSLLSLSTLHKLVPVVLRSSICRVFTRVEVGEEAHKQEQHQRDIATKCYCLLVEYFYQPTFDSVCDSLLPVLLLQETVGKITDGEGSTSSTPLLKKKKKKSNENWSAVTCSTLRLLRSRLQSANPKKSFQLLVRPATFATLARLYCQFELIDESSDENGNVMKTGKNVMKNLIRDGIFDLDHHMNGFKSVQFRYIHEGSLNDNSKPNETKRNRAVSSSSESVAATFQCYQQGLVIVLGYFLGKNEIIQTGKEETPDNRFYEYDDLVLNSSAVASFMPLLLDVFFEQTTEMQKNLHDAHNKVRVTSKKHKSVQKLGEIQFRFFEYLTSYVMTSYQSQIGTNLTVKRKPLTSPFSIIRQNVDLLLKFNVYQPSMNNPSEKAFLDKVATSLILALTNKGNKKEGSDFYLTANDRRNIFKGLEVLIQLNHLCLHGHLSIVLGPCLTFLTHEEEEKSKESKQTSMNASIETCDLLSVILVTYSKLRQLDIFFQSFIGSIVDMLKNGLRAGILTWVSLLNNDQMQVRIATAISTSPAEQLKIAISALNESIVDLVSGSISHVGDGIIAASAIAQALDCIMNAVPLDIVTSKSMSSLSAEVMNKAVNEMSSNMDDRERVLVAVSLCASTMRLKNRCDFWLRDDNKSPDFESSDLLMPLPLLELLNTKISAKRNRKQSSPSIPLHAMQFLVCEQMQRLHAKMMVKEQISFSSDNEAFTVSPEKKELERLCSYLVQNAALDDDCFEIAVASIDIWAQHSSPRDIDSFLNDLLIKFVSERRNGPNKISIETDFVNILEDASFYEIPNVAPRLAQCVMSFVERHILEALSYTKPRKGGKNNLAITKCYQVLQLFIGSDLPIWNECLQPVKVFKTCLRLEKTCLSKLKENDEQIESWAMVVAQLRLSASKVAFSSVQTGIQIGSIKDILLASGLLLRLQADENISELILQSGNTLVASIIDCENFSGDEMSQGAEEAVKILFSSFLSNSENKSGTDFLVLASYAAEMIERLGRETPANSPALSTSQLLQFTVENLWPKAIGFVFQDRYDGFLLRNVSVQLIACLLRWAPASSLQQFCDFRQLEGHVLERAKRILRSNYQGECSQHDIFLVTALASSKPSREFCRDLLEAIATSKSARMMLFEPAACALALNIDSDEFASFLDRFLDSDMYSMVLVEKSSMIHTVVISALKDCDKRGTIASRSSSILETCVQNLFHGHNHDRQKAANVIVETSSFIVEIASRKDVVVLRERDIALLIAGITSSMKTLQNPLRAIDGTESPTVENSSVYDACFSLVAFILQRFAKQAHSCVPSIMLILNVMMEHVIQYPMEEDSIRLCGQKFSRLVELLLPHADVYKKHVVCLLVKFVDGLGAEMDVFRKNALMPSIFCLFDMIQQHEMVQLNSMLDEVGRILLRPVHENYKKVHVYKGQ